MTQTFGIVVELDPAKAIAGIDAFEARLAAIEANARKRSDKIGEALAGGLGGGKVAQELERQSRAAEQAQARQSKAAAVAEREAKRAAAEQAKAARVVAQTQAAEANKAAREQERAAREAARIQAKEAKEAAAAQIREAKRAAVEQSKAAKEAQRAQVAAAKQAKAEVVALERQARRELEREAQRDPAKALGVISLSPTRAGTKAGAAAAGGLGGLAATATATVGAALGARELIGMADSYTDVTNRVKQLTSSSAELEFVQRRLFDVAQNTGTEYGEVAKLYSGAGKAARDLGLSHDQASAFTETLSKAIKASGASAAGAEAALEQLGQGLRSGTLRGEEFNSVAEQAPVLLELLGKSLGKNIGELRKMAEEGQITAKTFIEGIQAQASAVDEAYAGRLTPLRKEWNKLHNELTNGIGKLSQNTGAVKAVAAVFISLAASFRDLVGLTQAVVGTIGSIGDALDGLPIDTLKLLAQLNPIGLGGRIATYAYEQITAPDQVQPLNPDSTERSFLRSTFQSAITPYDRNGALAPGTSQSRNEDPLGRTPEQRAADVAKATKELDARNKREKRTSESHAIQEAKELAKQLRQLADETDAVGKARREFADAEKNVDRAVARGIITQEHGNEILARKRLELKDQLDPAQAVIDSIREETSLLGLSDEARARTVEMRGIEAKLLKEGVDLWAQENSAIKAWIVTALNARDAAKEAAAERKKAEEQQNAVLAVQREIYDSVHGAEQRRLVTIQAATAEYERGALTQAQYTSILKEHRDPASKAISDLQDEIALLQLNSEEREIAIAVMQFENEVRRSGREATDAETEAVIRLAKAKRMAMAAGEKKDAAQKEMDELKNAAKRLGNELKTTLTQGFNSALDGLIDFTLTGKHSFEDLARSVADSVAKIVAKMLLLEGVKAIFGVGEGNDFGNFLTGLISGNHAAGGNFLVGGTGTTDSQLVAFRATPGERVTVTPRGETARATAPNVNVPVKVVIVSDQREAIREQMRSADGERVVVEHIVHNSAKIRAALAR